ncbi:MAG: hypothetical protein WC435_03905 [Candidatus Paceibacterota bacterium]
MKKTIIREVFSEAYFLLFLDYPLKEMNEEEVAEKILDYFDIRRLGIERAREFLMEVITNHGFPEEHIRRIVGEAESLATEVFFEIKSDEPHMAELENIYYQHHPLFV